MESEFARGGDDVLSPRGPEDFLVQAAKGRFDGPMLRLMAAWMAFYVFSSTLWAIHLRRAAGWSSLPTYWGEQINGRDLWEMAINGGLAASPAGFWTTTSAVICLGWALWAGWGVQASAAGRRAALRPWLFGFLDALIIGVLPIAIPTALTLWLLGKMALTGIQWLGWLDLVAGSFLRLAASSAFLLQWWLCRGARAQAGHSGYGLGSFKQWGLFLKGCLGMFWMNILQWSLLLGAGVAIRAGLHVAVFFTVWRLGGGSPFKVCLAMFLQLLAVVVSAWVMGVMLRLVSFFVLHDMDVRREIAVLES